MGFGVPICIMYFTAPKIHGGMSEFTSLGDSIGISQI